MWDLLRANAEPVQTLASIGQIIGLILVILGLGFTAVQVRYAASQAQGTTIQETANTSRELVMKMWDDPGLRPLVDPKAKDIDPVRAQAYLGVLIQLYSTIFRQSKLGNIPPDYLKEVRGDATVFFNSPIVKRRWDQVRGLYQPDFQRFVDGLISSSPGQEGQR